MNGATFKNAMWTLVVAGVLTAGCGGDVKRAGLLIRQGANLPCLGVRRIAVTVSKNEASGRSAVVFGKFYHVDGNCNLPDGLPLEISGLPYAESMSIRVEGFDSSRDRVMCQAEMSVGRDQVETGDLGEIPLDREAVDDGGVLKYPTGTLEIPSLPGIDSVGQVDSLSFIINAGTQDSINGRFLTDPEVPLADTTLVLSSLLPRDPPNSMIIVARHESYTIGKWMNTSSFTIGEMITSLPMSKEP